MNQPLDGIVGQREVDDGGLYLRCTSTLSAKQCHSSSLYTPQRVLEVIVTVHKCCSTKHYTQKS